MHYKTRVAVKLTGIPDGDDDARRAGGRAAEDDGGNGSGAADASAATGPARAQGDIPT
jgi:hypothetical protein